MAGPLEGVRVVELAGIGPGPFAAMVLADLGADVVRVDRAGTGLPADVTDERRAMARNRRSIAVDLKSPEGVEVVLRLVEASDILVEGFRPGVTERLGLGPDVCLERNPALVYGRMTGWGQTGPLSSTAGHDIDYIAIAGALEPIGRAGERPVPPLNLVGDFGGGGMLLAVGALAALTHARVSGKGQVVDAAMVDGAALLTTIFHELRAFGTWPGDRGENFLDTGAHFYNTYETADGKYVALGAIEPQFWAEFLELVGWQDEDLPHQLDASTWPDMERRLQDLFLTRSRDEWTRLLGQSDACFAPVLSMWEAPSHPHNVERGTFVDVGGVTQPAPAPRFSATPAAAPRPWRLQGQDSQEVLEELGYDASEVDKLLEAGAVEVAPEK